MFRFLIPVAAFALLFVGSTAFAQCGGSAFGYPTYSSTVPQYQPVQWSGSFTGYSAPVQSSYSLKSVGTIWNEPIAVNSVANYAQPMIYSAPVSYSTTRPMNMTYTGDVIGTFAPPVSGCVNGQCYLNN